MTVDEREREKLRDILQAMAIESNHVDMEVSKFLWNVVKRLADGGSVAGLTRRAYWHVRAIANRDGWARFTSAWSGFARMEHVSADVLRDIAAGCCDNANRRWYGVKRSLSACAIILRFRMTCSVIWMGVSVARAVACRSLARATRATRMRLRGSSSLTARKGFLTRTMSLVTFWMG